MSREDKLHAKDEIQPTYPRSVIGAFVVRCLDSITPMHVVALSEISRLYLPSVAKQADLSPTWSHTPKNRISHDVAHLKSMSHLKLHNVTLTTKIQDGGYKPLKYNNSTLFLSVTMSYFTGACLLVVLFQPQC